MSRPVARSGRTIVGLALALALSATAAAAVAEPLDLGPAQLTLDVEWTGPTAAPTRVVRTRGDTTVVAVRYEVPNVAAWRDSTRAAHVDAIAAGFAIDGWTIEDQALTRLGRAAVPTLDLTLTRRGPRGRERAAVRVLLFRTLTWVAIAGGGDRRAVEAAARALSPE